MRVFVESLKRLYSDGRIGEDKVKDLFANKKISQEEMEYILRDPDNG